MHTRPSARIPRPSYRPYLPATVSVGMERVAMELMRALAGSCWHALVAVRQPLKYMLFETKAKDIAGD